jgi:hypothetical protein
VEPLVYRVTFGARSVVFALNDLSAVKPPPGAVRADERYLGPIFDESAIRFFFVYNPKARVFHYILDETAPVADVLLVAYPRVHIDSLANYTIPESRPRLGVSSHWGYPNRQAPPYTLPTPCL